MTFVHATKPRIASRIEKHRALASIAVINIREAKNMNSHVSRIDTEKGKCLCVFVFVYTIRVVL